MRPARRRLEKVHACETPTGHGNLHDSWRCWCGRLWRLGPICDACDYYRGSHPHGGQCVIVDLWGNHTKWRQASIGQRLRHRLHTRAWRTAHEIDIPLPIRIKDLERRTARMVNHE